MSKWFFKHFVFCILLSGVAAAQPVSTDRTKVWDGAQTLDITAGNAAEVEETGAALTALQLLDNNIVSQGATTAGQVGSLILASTTTSGPTYTAGTLNPLNTNNSGELRTTISSWGAFVDKNDGAVSAQTVRVTYAGTVAHDAADSGNPLKIGHKAYSANPTAVATGDRADSISDLIGRTVVAPYTIPENMYTACSASTITDTSSTSVKASAGAGVRNYITALSISNMDASVATRVDILDGSTVIWQCPAGVNGGGCTVNFPTPLRGTAATAVNAQAATTSAEVRVCVSGYTASN